MQEFQEKTKLILIFALLGLVGCTIAPTGPAENDTAVLTQPPATEVTVSATAVNTPNSPATAVETSPKKVEIVKGGQTIGDPYAPELGNTGYDVQHYDIQLNLDPQKKYEIEGSVQIDALSTIDNLAELSLDFVGFDINELAVDGETAGFERKDEKLIITLPEPLVENESFEISVSYAGETVQAPSPYVGFASWLGLFYARDNTIYVLSEPDGSRYWFPNNDHPRDKATYRFALTVPNGFTAVANGTLIDEQDNTFIWEHDYPMASYLATIAVGKYERLDDQSPSGVPLRHYTFNTSQSLFEHSTQMTGEAIDWMSDLFGPYPYEEYGYVTVHAPGVSLETQTIVLLSTDMLNERTVIHELAHMWFGDWVSLDSWGEMWRNEGFATYLSIMWDHRDDPEGLELEMAGVRTALEERGSFPPLKNPPPGDLFSGFTYFGGALMIHQLRQEVGDEAFFAGLQDYFQEFGGGTASDADFIAIMEEAAGKDLTGFFEEWLE